MGTKTSLAAIVPATNHLTAANKAGRNPNQQLVAAQEAIGEIVVALKVILSDMQVGDSNITTVNTLITNLS